MKNMKQIESVADNFNKGLDSFLLNLTNDLIYCFDRAGRFTKVNTTFCKALRLDQSDIIGKTYYDLGFDKEVCKQWDALLLEVFVSEKPLVSISEVKIPNRGSFSFKLNVYPIPDEHDKVTNVAVITSDITLLEEVKKEFTETTDEFLNIIENAPDIMIIHAEGKFLFINKKTVELSKGSGKEDFTGKSVFDFVHPDYQELAHKRVDMILKNKAQVEAIEQKYVCFDGSCLDVEVKSIPIKFKQKDAILVVAKDITEQKIRERKIEEINKHLEILIEAIPDAVFLKDGEGRWKTLNLAAIKLFDLANIDWYEKTDRELALLQPAQSAIYENCIQSDNETWDSGEISYFIEIIPDLNGKRHQYEITKVPLFEPDGKRKGLVIIGRDVTKQKEEEAHLKLLETAIVNTSETIIITEAYPFEQPGPKILFVNNAFEKTTGYSKEEAIGKTPRILQGKKSDRKELARLKKAIENWQSCEIETVNYRKNGEAFWTKIAVVPVADENGRYTHWVSAQQDISNQKKEEARLKLLETVITNATDAVVITEAVKAGELGPKIIYVNDAYLKMTGYSWDEVIGSSPKILQGKNTDRNELNKLRKAIENNQSCEIEVINYKKNGEEFWSNIAISPVVDDKGQTIYWIAIKRDTTLSRKHDQLVKKAMITGQENEKYFIGRELHDNVAQLLVGTKLALSQIKGSNPKEAQMLKETKQYLDDSIMELRYLSHNLAPASFKSDNFIQTIDGLLKTINKEGRFKITKSYDHIDQTKISSEIKLNLYRILQEQLQNIIKHAEASAIEINLRLDDHCIKLHIGDDGVGFDTSKPKEGIGIQNIITRTESFSGVFNLRSSPGKGCELLIEIPV